MTRPVNGVESLMRTVHCERCGARPGEPCTSRTDRIKVYAHAERFYEAERIGLFASPQTSTETTT